MQYYCKLIEILLLFIFIQGRFQDIAANSNERNGKGRHNFFSLEILKDSFYQSAGIITCTVHIHIEHTSANWLK